MNYEDHVLVLLRSLYSKRSFHNLHFQKVGHTLLFIVGSVPLVGFPFGPLRLVYLLFCQVFALRMGWTTHGESFLSFSILQERCGMMCIVETALGFFGPAECTYERKIQRFTSVTDPGHRFLHVLLVFVKDTPFLAWKNKRV
jgi:hypothetical protein